jgi:DNA invertase Pin-like site-specific DNA recombinase
MGIDPYINSISNPHTKRRVASYARVSTDSEEQENSFVAQMDYYSRKIADNLDWELVKVYADEGISGTNTKHREGFKSMVADALAGKIDLIVTKSVSRFARNTVDSLNTIRLLKSKGVECWFEKEAIWTFDGKGELLVTIMSSLAQEESRSLSENVRWGKRRSFEEGKVSLPYKRFLGYERGADGRPKIVESEAKTVREIFDLYLQGMTVNGICRQLTEKGIPTPGGKTNWGVPTVRSILQNEKYRGDALLQKSFTIDYLEKIRKKNEGEIPQFYVENSHPPIVKSEVFDLVQEDIRKNKELGQKRRAGHIFSSKVICGECGGVFGSKVWNSCNKFKRKIWQCNEKYKVKGQVKCKTPAMSDESLEKAFILAFNQIIGNKETYIADYISISEILTDTSRLDQEILSLKERCNGVYAEIKACIDDNTRRSRDQVLYQKEYQALVDRYESIRSRLDGVETEKQNCLLRKEKIVRFLEDIRKREGLLTEFDEAIFQAFVENMTVYSKTDLAVKFRDGNEIHVNIG